MVHRLSAHANSLSPGELGRRSGSAVTARLAVKQLVAACLVATVVACRAAPSPERASNDSAQAALARAASARAASIPDGATGALAAGALPYVEIMTGGARAEEREPLVVALHGLGDRPESFVGVFDGFSTPARVVAPHSTTRYGDGYSWFEFRRTDPDFSAPGIRKAADDVAGFATAVAARRPTIGRPIVVGFSQGGAIGFALAALHPEAIDAAFPISGWFPASLWPDRKAARTPPVVAFHGAADTLVPPARMRPGASHLAELGYSIDVREFEGVGHAIPQPVRQALFDALATACERERHTP